jgi:hypothetical protein
MMNEAPSVLLERGTRRRVLRGAKAVAAAFVAAVLGWMVSKAIAGNPAAKVSSRPLDEDCGA